MPVAIACPNCQTKYSIQESLLGRPVKCRKCGSVFQTEPNRNAQPVNPQPQPRSNAGDLAGAGLQGEIEGSQQLFGDAPPTGIDPLGNHVVFDPGFGQSGLQASEQTVNPEQQSYDDLLSNRAIKEPEEVKKRDPLREYLTPEEIAGKPAKKTKSKEEEGEYGGVASLMYWVGGLLIVLNVIDYFYVLNELQDMSGPEVDAVKFYAGLFLGLIAGAGVLMIVFGALVTWFPISSILAGIVVFGSVVATKYYIVGFENPRAIGLDVFITLALIFGLVKAINKRRYGEEDPSKETKEAKKAAKKKAKKKSR